MRIAGQKDEEAFFDFAKVLSGRNVQLKYQALNNSSPEQSCLHQRYLRDCDSAIVYWASASDTWVKVMSNELGDWRQLGRA